MKRFSEPKQEDENDRMRWRKSSWTSLASSRDSRKMLQVIIILLLQLAHVLYSTQHQNFPHDPICYANTKFSQFSCRHCCCFCEKQCEISRSELETIRIFSHERRRNIEIVENVRPQQIIIQMSFLRFIREATQKLQI